MDENRAVRDAPAATRGWPVGTDLVVAQAAPGTGSTPPPTLSPPALPPPTLSTRDVAGTLVGLAVPDLADWALVVRLGTASEVADVVGGHADEEDAEVVDELVRALPTGLRSVLRATTLLAGGDTLLLDLHRLRTREVAGLVGDACLADHVTQLRTRSVLVVALPDPGAPGHLLVLGRQAGSAPFDPEDPARARGLARRAGLSPHGLPRDAPCSHSPCART